MSVLVLGLVSAVSFAGELDGKTFCRTIKTDGSFGQPKGERQHCVSFKENQMTDNANTFFGNPPEHLKYVLVAGKVLVVDKAGLASEYTVSEKLDLLENGAGAQLKLK